MMWHKVLWW